MTKLYALLKNSETHALGESLEKEFHQNLFSDSNYGRHNTPFSKVCDALKTVKDALK